MKSNIRYIFIVFIVALLLFAAPSVAVCEGTEPAYTLVYDDTAANGNMKVIAFSTDAEVPTVSNVPEGTLLRVKYSMNEKDGKWPCGILFNDTDDYSESVGPGERTFTMTENVTPMTLNYGKKYPLELSAPEGNGTIAVNSDYSAYSAFIPGDTFIGLDVTPDPGYELKKLRCYGTNIADSSTQKDMDTVEIKTSDNVTTCRFKTHNDDWIDAVHLEAEFVNTKLALQASAAYDGTRKHNSETNVTPEYDGAASLNEFRFTRPDEDASIYARTDNSDFLSFFDRTSEGLKQVYYKNDKTIIVGTGELVPEGTPLVIELNNSDCKVTFQDDCAAGYFTGQLRFEFVMPNNEVYFIVDEETPATYDLHFTNASESTGDGAISLAEDSFTGLTIRQNSKLNIKATPNEGSYLKKLEAYGCDSADQSERRPIEVVEDDDSDGSYFIHVNDGWMKHVYVVATFELGEPDLRHTITVSTAAADPLVSEWFNDAAVSFLINGETKTGKSVIANEGETVQLSVQSGNGYKLYDVTPGQYVGETEWVSGNKFSFTMPDEDVTLNVSATEYCGRVELTYGWPAIGEHILSNERLLVYDVVDAIPVYHVGEEEQLGLINVLKGTDLPVNDNVLTSTGMDLRPWVDADNNQYTKFNDDSAGKQLKVGYETDKNYIQFHINDDYYAGNVKVGSGAVKISNQSIYDAFVGSPVRLRLVSGC